MARGLGAEPSSVRIEKLSPQLGDDRSEREPDSGFFLGSVSGMATWVGTRLRFLVNGSGTVDPDSRVGVGIGISPVF